MDDERLKSVIGANIAAYRKRGSLTQAGLAEKLNYSDKAVSKWERGESVPDVLTLVQLAEQFHVSVNDLLVDPDALPEKTGVVQQAMEQVVEKTLKRKATNSWLAFIYAIPVNAIVLLSMRSAWHDFRWNRGLISVIMWGCLISIYMSLLILAKLNIWKIFLLGIPGQLAIFLWFRLFSSNRGREERNG